MSMPAMTLRPSFRICSTALLVLGCDRAFASESVTYTYDALGRLTQSATTGGVDNGLSVGYTLDASDNRIAYTITGSPGSGVPDVTVIVLPLNGFTIIPIVSQP